MRFRSEDLFKADFHDATVPGTLIVSHQFDMGTWQPDKKVELTSGRTIYLWTITPRRKP